jgi:hypothetical protein
VEWSKTDGGWMGERADRGLAELLVAVIGEPRSPLPDLKDIAADWARSLPSAAFVVFDLLADVGTRLSAVLAGLGLPVTRLLLVGIGDGGVTCLNIAFKAAPFSIGVLIYGPTPDLLTAGAPPRSSAKIRLVGFDDGSPLHGDLLGAMIHRLRTAGIDASAAELAEPGMTPSAIRRGAAYLAELSASALALPRPSAGPTA